MLPIIAGIVSQLVANNLPKLAQAVTDKGVKYVEDKLGLPLKPDMSEEELTRIRQEAQKFEEFQITTDLANLKDARAMQVAALSQDDLFSKRFVYYFISFWSVVSATYIAFVTFAIIPESNTRTADTVLGIILGTIITGMFNYLIGSTITSRQKNDMLAKRAQDESTGHSNNK